VETLSPPQDLDLVAWNLNINSKSNARKVLEYIDILIRARAALCHHAYVHFPWPPPVVYLVVNSLINITITIFF
jgi:hypothetical protein